MVSSIVQVSRSRVLSRRGRSLLLATCLASSLVVVGALAGAISPESPAVIVVGKPGGCAPSDRLDSSRRGLASTSLPARPIQLWRRDLPDGLDFSPVIDGAGNTVAAVADGRLIKLDVKGRRQWQVDLRHTVPVSAPVLTSDGSVAVLGADGALWVFTAAGTLRYRTVLQISSRQAQATPLALDDGSVIVAGEVQLVHIDASGYVVARATLPGRPAGGLLRWRQQVVATTGSGDVYGWQSPKRPRKLGTFGKSLYGGAVLLDKRNLAGVVGADQVVLMDLRNGRQTLLMSGSSGLIPRRFNGPVSFDAHGVLWVTTTIGELLGVDARGMLVRRVALENRLLLFSPDAGSRLSSYQRRYGTKVSPPLVVDSGGRVGYVRASGRLGVVDENGQVQLATSRFCGQPLALLPAGQGRMLVACRGGLLGLYGDGSLPSDDGV